MFKIEISLCIDRHTSEDNINETKRVTNKTHVSRTVNLWKVSERVF